MSRFAIGDRVIAAHFHSPYACDLTGFYGHVVEINGLVLVRLQGCTADAPDRKNADQVIRECDGEPWPFFATELEHAD